MLVLLRQKICPLSVRFSGVLDLGGEIVDGGQLTYQFIELYNTDIEDITELINDAGEIDLKGWTLTFTEDSPVPANDVDQVSNIAGTGWIVDVGQSGRKALVLVLQQVPVRLFLLISSPCTVRSITRKYKTPMAVIAAKRLEGVPGGNAKGGWAASSRATRETGVIDSYKLKHFVDARSPNSDRCAAFTVRYQRTW